MINSLYKIVVLTIKRRRTQQLQLCFVYPPFPPFNIMLCYVILYNL